MKTPQIPFASRVRASAGTKRAISSRRLIGALALLTLALGGNVTMRGQSVYEPYVFSTYPAATSTRATNASGRALSFNSPAGVAVDKTGNVYVADTDNHALRKITPNGVIVTLAGSPGKSGSTDGLGSAARFYYPKGVAVDDAGTLYVADTANQTIRKVTPAGVVTTLAGLAGSIGSADGKGSAARFYYPYGVATDGAGNVYVADTFNNTIRKITPADVVRTIAGLAGGVGSVDGQGNAARFNYPCGLAVDNASNVYVADAGNQTIRKIAPNGTVNTFAGSPGRFGSADGLDASARFSYPNGVAADNAGNIYVADTVNQTIRMITRDGVVSTLAGLPGAIGHLDATGSAVRLNHPAAVAIDNRSRVYVADTYNHTIRMGRAAGYLDSDTEEASLQASETPPPQRGAQSQTFSPTPTPTPTPPTEIFGIADDGTPLQWDVYTPTVAGPWPVVLIIHGGGFRETDGGTNMVAAAQDLQNAGYLTLVIEYRLAPLDQSQVKLRTDATQTRRTIVKLRCARRGQIHAAMVR